MPPPLAAGRKTRPPLSASPDSSPGSNPRPFSFGDLGRPQPALPSGRPRLLPPIPEAAASGDLDELSADDILESNDLDAIDAFEMAAADIQTFVSPFPVAVAPAPPAAAPPSAPGFAVAEMAAWDNVEVEGLAHRATEPSPPPAAIAIIAQIEPAEPAPVSMKLDYTAPQPSTLIGFPAAPVTSPLPVEASVIVADLPEQTLELKSDTTAKVAAAAAHLEDDDGLSPEKTQVLVRSQMPPELQTPSRSAAAWQNGRHPQSGQTPVAPRVPSSIAPVALGARAAMPSIPLAAPTPQIHPAKSGMSGLLIGGLAFAAAALIGVVGVGGYLASRTLSTKAESIATAPAPEPEPAAAAPADPAAAPADPVAAPSPAAPIVGSGAVDVSALPSAPAPRAVAPVAPVAAGAVSPAPARTVAGNASRASGLTPPSSGGSQAPSGRAGAPLAAPGGASPPSAAISNPGALPPPPSKAPPAAAPAAAVSSTGTVNVDPKLRAVVVDGSSRRVNDGAVTLTCGSHRIKVGMNDVQSVNVPCGGSVSL